MIRPGVPAPNLAARLGEAVVRERGAVRYRELRSRSLLNPCDSPRVPFRFTANPYRGCAMGCRYCYATYTHEYIGIDGGTDFHTTIFVKTTDLKETARQLNNVVRRGELMALGTATDPYQPGEGTFGITRRFLELVAQHRGARLGITTKGALILRDVDVLKRIHARSHLSIQVSLISLRADLLRQVEPWAPPPEVRLETVARLREAGLDVGVGVAPVLPGLTDREEDLDALFARIASIGVTRVWCGTLFLRSPTKEKYMRWLEADFPRYVEAYRRAYANRVYLGGAYRARIDALTDKLRQRYSLETPRFLEARPEPPLQLGLWA